jgi:hypothetical protein
MTDQNQQEIAETMQSSKKEQSYYVPQFIFSACFWSVQHAGAIPTTAMPYAVSAAALSSLFVT